MNLGFMQKLAEQGNQAEQFGMPGDLQFDSPGKHLGQLAQAEGVDPAHAGLTPAIENAAKTSNLHDRPAGPGQPQTLGATFANEIIRRMEAGGESATDENGQPKDNTDLRHSLGQALDWVRERFGDEAGAAAAGMIAQSTSSGVTEESLGDGLLNTLKLIDRNFGIAAGDSAIAKFNQTVNTELNEYFDNGKSELFIATTTAADGPSATQDLNTRLFMRAVQESSTEDKDEPTLTEQLLESLKDELDEAGELQNLASQLEEDASPTKATQKAAMAAYADASIPVEPQFTSVSV